jgi:membrane associated rhomboid family serine protease
MDDRNQAAGEARAPDGGRETGGPRGASLFDLAETGPLTRDQARALIDRGAELLGTGEPLDAARHYARVIGQPDPAITGAAMLGLGQALRQLDRDDEALATWIDVTRLPESPATYRAWREIAAARVRSGDLRGALAAYREADRRAPQEDRAEIASRLGWLSKEMGDTRAARRHFARAREGGPPLPLTWIVIGITVIVSVTAWSVPELYPALELTKSGVASGEYYRLWTVTLLHAPPGEGLGILHLLFNMYALYIVGPIVETLYGSRLFLGFYLLLAAAASVASFVFGPQGPSVGASGAIFGLFGLLLAASRTHQPMLDRRRRSLVGQLGPIIAINLAFGFLNGQAIDNSAHVGGLVAGLWLGYLLVPGKVPTLSRLWTQSPNSPNADTGAEAALRMLGVLALVLVIAVGLVIGTQIHRSAGTNGLEHAAAPAPVTAGIRPSGSAAAS